MIWAIYEKCQFFDGKIRLGNRKYKKTLKLFGHAMKVHTEFITNKRLSNHNVKRFEKSILHKPVQ